MAINYAGALKKHLQEENERATQDRLHHGTLFYSGVKKSSSNSNVADALEDEDRAKEVTRKEHMEYQRLQREHEQLKETTSIALEKKTMEIQRLSDENFVRSTQHGI